MKYRQVMDRDHSSGDMGRQEIIWSMNDGGLQGRALAPPTEPPGYGAPPCRAFAANERTGVTNQAVAAKN